MSVAQSPSSSSGTSAENHTRLHEILKTFLPDGDRITSVRKIGDGHSNDTYLLEGIECVLRAAPISNGLMPDYDIERQYQILASIGAAQAGLPVPEVFGLCTDPSIIGRPFFLMRRCPGGSTDWKAPSWMIAGGTNLRERLSRNWIGAVARIHSLPAGILPEPARTVADEARYWLELAVGAKAPAELIAVLEDLADDPPPTSGSATIVHGDPKFANFLWSDHGELTAVLDWEFAHVGEPLIDLGYLLGLWPSVPGEKGQMPYTELSGWWSRERIIAEWESATGRRAVGLDRYELLGMAQIATIFARGIELHRTGRSTDPRLGRWDRSLEAWLASMRKRSGTLYPRTGQEKI